MSKLKKAMYLLVGLIAFVLGFIGIFLPLLPTTPLFLLTSFCLLKSSEKLNEKLNSIKPNKKYKSVSKYLVSSVLICILSYGFIPSFRIFANNVFEYIFGDLGIENAVQNGYSFYLGGVFNRRVIIIALRSERPPLSRYLIFSIIHTLSNRLTLPSTCFFFRLQTILYILLY